MCALALQRITEAYLGFKTYIDKLTEKSFRVAFPLFQFQYWLWMNRVSLVSNVLETLSLLVASLSSPYKSVNVQKVAWVLFYTFHLLHVVSHFLTFNELKRSFHVDLVSSLRRVLNGAAAAALCSALFRLAYALSGVAGLQAVAHLLDWGFFGCTFAWHFMIQREFIAPEDTRLYVGRRIALGASVRCSECLRPFSKSRSRETCADCRDECCSECGSELHLAELGASVDMSLFCCSKCHRLLLAEVSAARARSLLRPAAGTGAASASAAAGGPASDGGAPEVCRMFLRGGFQENTGVLLTDNLFLKKHRLQLWRLLSLFACPRSSHVAPQERIARQQQQHQELHTCSCCCCCSNDFFFFVFNRHFWSRHSSSRGFSCSVVGRRLDD